MIIIFAELKLRTGTNLSNVTIVRNISDFSFDTKYADVGVVNFSIPISDANAIGLGVNSVVEVCPNATSGLPNMYYTLDGYQSTQTSDGIVMASFNGKSLVNWLTDCVVYPSTWPSVPQVNPDGTTSTVITGHSFLNASPGNILRTLVARGVERGGLAWLDVSTFTGTTTSDNVAWNTSLTVSYSTGTSLLSVLQDLASRRLIEFKMQGSSLRVYNYGAGPTHYTPEQILFRRGVDLSEQTRTVDGSDISSVVLCIGDDAAITESDAAHNAPALAAVGRRRERFVTQSGITDLLTLQYLANAEIGTNGHVQTEDTLGVIDAKVKPWLDYTVGDWVWVDFDGILKNIQIKQITGGLQDNGILSIGLTLGDLIKDQDEKLQNTITNITGGAGGTYGALPVNPDYTGPGAVGNVNATSSASRDSNGADSVAVTITWTRPTTDSTGAPITNLDHYEIRYQVGAAVGGTVWTSLGNVPANASSLAVVVPGLPPGSVFVAQVRAADTKGNYSSWVTQTNPIASLPGVSQTLDGPSTPSLTPIFKGVVISWDGLDGSGDPFDDQLPNQGFSSVNFYLGTVSGFTAGQSTFVGSINSLGGSYTVVNLDYTKTYYAKIIVVAKGQNFSPASSVSNGVQPAKIAPGDVTNIGGSNVFTQATQPSLGEAGDLWINTSQNNAIYVYDGNSWKVYQFGTGALGPNSVDASKIVAAGLTAGVIASGTISAATINMATNSGGTPATINIGSPGYNGIQLSSAGGLTAWTAGTQTLSVSSSGTVTVTGSFQTGANGQRVTLLPEGVLRFWAPGAPNPVAVDGSMTSSDGSKTLLQIRSALNHCSLTISPYDTSAASFYFNFGGDNSPYGQVVFQPQYYAFINSGGSNGTSYFSYSSAPGVYSGRLIFSIDGYNQGCLDYYYGDTSPHFRCTTGYSNFVGITASAFNVASSQEIKTDIVSYSENSLDVVKSTPIFKFKRKMGKVDEGKVKQKMMKKKHKEEFRNDDVIDPGIIEEHTDEIAGPEEIGFVVERSHDSIVTPESEESGDKSISMAQTVAVLWSAVQQLSDKIDKLENKQDNNKEKVKNKNG